MLYEIKYLQSVVVDIDFILLLFFYRSQLRLSISEDIKKSIEIGESPEGHKNYLAFAYFLSICNSILDENAQDAQIMLNKLFEMNINIELNFDDFIYRKYSSFLVNTFKINEFSVDEFNEIISIIKEYNFYIQGCMVLGLGLSPFIINKKIPANYDLILRTFRDFSKESNCTFWCDLLDKNLI